MGIGINNMTEIFDGSVQYNDWKGTAAADNNFGATILKILSDQKLIAAGEILIGVSLYTGENGFISISAYLTDAAGAETKKDLDANQIPTVKKVDVDNLSVEQFLSTFKRFNVVMSRKGMNLIGRVIEKNG